MKVLIACEESQEVCKAFRAKGHEAYSCDIQMCSGDHPEWHILGDALTVINGNKIFEGDIVVSDYIDYEDERGVIQWDSDIAKFIITFSTFTIDFDNVYGRELEIVGNVYDNPELLEAGEMP